MDVVLNHNFLKVGHHNHVDDLRYYCLDSTTLLVVDAGMVTLILGEVLHQSFKSLVDDSDDQWCHYYVYWAPILVLH